MPDKICSICRNHPKRSKIKCEECGANRCPHFMKQTKTGYVCPTHSKETTTMKETIETLSDELVESVSIDLKRMSGIEFRKKYGKNKFQMRAQISSQPIARKHFGYAPTGNAAGKWNASTSAGGNPARKDKVSGVRKALANKQPGAKLHRKGGVGGASFKKEEYEKFFQIALDEFGVTSLAELNTQEARNLLIAVDQLVEFVDEEGNSYGPFWTE